MAGVFVTCKICGKTYEMGENGVVDGCDQCLKIKRDKWGHYWEPGKKSQRYMNISTGKVFDRKRPKGI